MARKPTITEVAMLALVAVAGPAAGRRGAPGSGSFVAGAGRVDITPPASALLHGDRVHDPLNVRAIYVGNGASCAVLVGIDQGNALNPVVADATARNCSGRHPRA